MARKKATNILNQYLDESEVNKGGFNSVQVNPRWQTMTLPTANMYMEASVSSETEPAKETQPAEEIQAIKSEAPVKNWLSSVDPDTDWSNAKITDYSTLNELVAAGKLSNDQRAEGQILFQNYISDLNAQNVYNKSVATAENEARKQTAYNDYIASKVASYLAEVQGNAGLEGYGGVTQGQAISLANMHQAEQQEVATAKNSAKQSALSAYQQALLENSQNYTDQYGTLMAARDEKADNDYNNYLLDVQNYIEKSLDEDGKISQTDYQKASDYIGDLNVTDSVKQRLEDYINLAYEDSVITDEEQSAKERQTKVAEISALTKDNYDTYLAGLTDAQKVEYKTELDKKESELYPKGRSEYIGRATYNSDGSYTFTYNGQKYKALERIYENPLGSDTGTFTKKEAENWNIVSPKDHDYKDMIAVIKDTVSYFYVKRNGKWYYLCNTNESSRWA